jgi:hypothetical protein
MMSQLTAEVATGPVAVPADSGQIAVLDKIFSSDWFLAD